MSRSHLRQKRVFLQAEAKNWHGLAVSSPFYRLSGRVSRKSVSFFEEVCRFSFFDVRKQ